MSRRRYLTPSPGIPAAGVPPARRAGGTRHEATERVRFLQGGRELSGWALNKSRGGLRAIVEDPVELGERFQITVGDEQDARPARIVWIQEEPDGAIVGLSYLDDVEGGSGPPAPGPRVAGPPVPVTMLSDSAPPPESAEDSSDSADDAPDE